MEENIRIDEREYASMLEDARKILETMSPEAIEELKTTCKDGLKVVTKVLETDLSKLKNMDKQIAENPIDYRKENPLRKAKRNFWLGQIANFIAVSVFKLPREFTPTYGYPHGSSKEYETKAQAMDDKLTKLVKEGKVISESTLSGLYEIMRNIGSDDAKLIAFCNSCNDIEAANSKTNVSPQFSKIASLLYQNNVSFPVGIYRTNAKDGHITDGVETLIENVTGSYDKARGNEVTKQY